MRLQAQLLRILSVFSLLASFLGFTGSVMAAVPAVVDSVQSPAWVERGARSLALAPGFELKSGDVVRTGPGARAYLKLAEGSTVKLGESARLALFSSGVRPEKSFRGALDVVTGAFRFTTDAARKASATRDVTIRVATATAGIRGTDVWGKAGKHSDLVALIEGRIELTRGGESFDLAPMTFMEGPHGAAAVVKPLDVPTLNVLGRETEILPGDGATRKKGRWSLALGEFADQPAALERYAQLTQAGFAVRVTPLAAENGWRYALRLAGFADETEAAIAAARIKAVTGVDAVPQRGR